MATSALAARGLTMASFEGISKNEATIKKIQSSFKIIRDFMTESKWNEAFSMNDLKNLANRDDVPSDVRQAAAYVASSPVLMKDIDDAFGRLSSQDGGASIGNFSQYIEDLEALKQDLRAEKGSSSSLTPNDVLDKARQIMPALMAKVKEKLEALEGNNNDPTKAMELKQALDELSQMTKLLTKALDGITKPVGDTLDSMR